MKEEETIVWEIILRSLDGSNESTKKSVKYFNWRVGFEENF
jgi:hypothetical protein